MCARGPVAGAVEATTSSRSGCGTHPGSISLVEQTQGQASETERRSDHRLLSTLRRYVEALGGKIEVVATFGDKRIRLHGA